MYIVYRSFTSMIIRIVQKMYYDVFFYPQYYYIKKCIYYWNNKIFVTYYDKKR